MNLYVDISNNRTSDFGMSALESIDLLEATESINLFHAQLKKLGPNQLKRDDVRRGIAAHCNRLETVTGFSATSIQQSFESLVVNQYSAENAFTDAAKVVWRKIVEWATRLKDWIKSLWKRLFNSSEAGAKVNKQSEQKIKQVEKVIKEEKVSPPTEIYVDLPGAYYLLFHTSSHKPKPGFVYNTKGFKAAIDQNFKDMTYFCDNLVKDLEHLISAFGFTKKQKDKDETINELTKMHFLKSAYRNKTELMGLKLTTKELQGTDTESYVFEPLTELTESWSQTTAFRLTLDPGELENVQKTLSSNNALILKRIINIVDVMDKAKLTDTLTTMAYKASNLPNDEYLKHKEDIDLLYVLMHASVGFYNLAVTLSKAFHAYNEYTARTMSAAVGEYEKHVMSQTSTTETP